MLLLQALRLIAVDDVCGVRLCFMDVLRGKCASFYLFCDLAHGTYGSCGCKFMIVFLLRLL